MGRTRYSANTAFLDLLFITVLGFASMFFLAFILMNQKTTQKAKITAKADYIITITWPKESNDDVDSYLEDPLEHLVFFQRREDGLMHLDRDDLGRRNDYVMTPYGPVTYNENQEIITIRGIIPGEYVLNVHMYHKSTTGEYYNYGYEEGGDEKPPAEDKPTVVTVKIEKMNPTVKLILIKKVTLEKNGDEKTVIRFTLDKDGEIKNLNDLPKAIANKRLNERSNPGTFPGGQE